jgi:DNA uptake protein ComE-like DNA-binding protein
MIDLNTASAEELASLPTLGLAAAYDLILYRPYLNWEEVEFAPGFDRARVRELRTAGATLGPPAKERALTEGDRYDLQA